MKTVLKLTGNFDYHRQIMELVHAIEEARTQRDACEHSSEEWFAANAVVKQAEKAHEDFLRHSRNQRARR